MRKIYIITSLLFVIALIGLLNYRNSYYKITLISDRAEEIELSKMKETVCLIVIEPYSSQHEFIPNIIKTAEKSGYKAFFVLESSKKYLIDIPGMIQIPLQYKSYFLKIHDCNFGVFLDISKTLRHYTTKFPAILIFKKGKLVKKIENCNLSQFSLEEANEN